MNRRHMVGTVGGAVLASAGALALAGCGSDKARSGQPSAPDTSRLAVPRVPVAPPMTSPLAAPVTPVMVAGFLAQFAERVNMRVVADDVRKWLDDTIQSARPELANIRQKMESHGFTDYPKSKVFGNGDVTVYGVANTDGINFCAPFMVNGRPAMGQGAVLAEGPALTALHLATQNWPKGSPVSMMEGLLPVAKLHDFGSQFEVGLDQPLHYGTKAGDLTIGYAADPVAGTGVLRVLSRLLTGETLLDRRYTFAWR